MSSILSWINQLDAWLNTPYISNHIVFIDRWSIVHVLFGAGFGFYFAKFYKGKHPWITAIILFIIWEIFERVMAGVFFKIETLLDKGWDLITDLIGFAFIWYWLKKPKKSSDKN